jgi:hypothetical protein
MEIAAPLSVGNGRFTYTCDCTGAQTFAGEFHLPPLCTMADWGWHTNPLAEELRGVELVLKKYEFAGRSIGYPTASSGQEQLFQWQRENPHRANLARVGFSFGDSAALSTRDISEMMQELDLFDGVVRSRYSVRGKQVRVITYVLPDEDTVAFRIESDLLRTRELSLQIAFPYPSVEMSGADWAAQHKHETECRRIGPRNLTFSRRCDDFEHRIDVGATHGIDVVMTEAHVARIAIVQPCSERESVTFFVHFQPSRKIWLVPVADDALGRTSEWWHTFWQSGAALNMGDSTSPQSAELERRAVLSQYLTAIQCAGTYPPQETGLTHNSWYGKFHLEMHWWHAVHFALWNRVSIFQRTVDYYREILTSAQERAQQQGFAGARWPKMTDPAGRESPSAINPLLIWQQPHPIAFAELLYRSCPTRKTLERYADVVFETAVFMADFVVWNGARGCYELIPPIVAVHEASPAEITLNPCFEIAYWRHGLTVAQAWRERLGLRREPLWDGIVTQMAPLPERDGVYLVHEGLPDTFGKFAVDHPSMLGALGMMPDGFVDRETMRRTLRRVLSEWRWETAWGWDFPMAALTATRLGAPDIALEALLHPGQRNTYLANGQNYQKDSLPTYLPGNGGLLTALGVMAAGWHGEPAQKPLFPRDKGWNVRAEGFNAWL